MPNPRLPRGALARLGLIAALAASVVFARFTPRAAHAHDIYTGVTDRKGQICCGGKDCAATIYRERAGDYEFLTRESHWVKLPQDRITFLPIPGDPPSDDAHHAHLCYRDATDADRVGGGQSNVFDGIYLYCAFIPPGGV